MALRPASPVQLVTRALRNGYQRISLPSTRHALLVFAFRGHPTQSTLWTANRSDRANDPVANTPITLYKSLYLCEHRDFRVRISLVLLRSTLQCAFASLPLPTYVRDGA